MILSPAELAQRLTSPKNSSRSRNLAKGIKEGRTTEDLDRNDVKAGPDLYIRNSGSGSRPGDQEHRLSPEFEIPITVLAKLGVSNTDLAETFDVSASKISTTKNNEDNQARAQEIINNALQGIRTKVVDKLNESL